MQQCHHWGIDGVMLLVCLVVSASLLGCLQVMQLVACGDGGAAGARGELTIRGVGSEYARVVLPVGLYVCSC